MKSIVFASLLLLPLGACGSSSENKSVESVSVKALSLETFAVRAPSEDNGCDFQTSFVKWFVAEHARDLKVVEQKCGDSKNGSLPEGFELFEGKCTRVCSFDVFTLEDQAGNLHKYYSMLSTTAHNRRTGMLTQSEPDSFSLYVKAGDYEAESYRSNVSKSPSAALPFLALTFDEAMRMKAL